MQRKAAQTLRQGRGRVQGQRLLPHRQPRLVEELEQQFVGQLRFVELQFLGQLIEHVVGQVVVEFLECRIQLVGQLGILIDVLVIDPRRRLQLAVSTAQSLHRRAGEPLLLSVRA